ncbi:hypothetical protein [Actinotalea subterranea]|uniref:hypothetical protein n=1 Tax=Actinotalea subterranea TaxID=2607497 RepID=UPI00165E1A9E|nr:hypothetical protein [Actinotalea subterranea]
MTRNVLAGTVLAAVAAATVLLPGLLGPDVQGVALLGAALGGALGLAPDGSDRPDRSGPGRVGAFALGLGAAWVAYVLRAAVLPDAPSGRAVAVLAVVLVCVAVTAAARGRVPLWATLLGAAAMAGAYEALYTADPSAVLTTSPRAATAVLLTAGAGFLATALLASRVPSRTAPAATDAADAADVHDRERDDDLDLLAGAAGRNGRGDRLGARRGPAAPAPSFEPTLEP